MYLEVHLEAVLSSLFSTRSLGPISLANRVVMSPMTRSRSIGNTPNELVAQYYGQRADAGLIITEGTSPSPDGLGYSRIPGLFTVEQARAWRQVTDAVHARGGRIFVQLMHTGRVGHALNLPPGGRVVAPSAIAAPGTMWTDQQQQQPHPEPHALTEPEIESAIEEYVASARLAVGEAGFDGVELHGANGYLIEQFLNTASNHRTDRWGGSVENRVRFAVEVARRTAAAIGADRLGMRISPYGAAGGMVADADTDALYERLAAELQAIGLVYLHLVDHSALGAPPVPASMRSLLRRTFRNTLILAGGYDRAKAEAALDAGEGDLVGFGRPFISNPDLVTRLRQGHDLAAPNFATFYTPGPEGYVDYPAL
jgi:N-ethylmaleimide reductase